ncbi:S41 family peptidase [Chondrinema litorale]|uniref:S41 family peptidase n=1 Tax=Chondrinema litorale TaxID=2994555 RepID=UPI00254281C9|nr:S41 family peptidase [Chondrinema litorale]UZR95236.1 S41 family peptidase [Chondrinema litorale]
MRLFLLSTLLTLSTSCFAQTDSIGFREDFSIFKTALLEAHPALYRFTPEKKFNAVLDSVEQQITSQTTDLQFFQLLSRIESLIREGHSGVNPSEYLKKQLHQHKIFPFLVHIKEDKLIVKESRIGKYATLKGAEIYAINGKKISEIITELEASTGIKSGFNNTFMLNRLSYDNNFSLAYYYFIDTVGTFKIDYKQVPEDVCTTEIEGVLDAPPHVSFPKRPVEPNPPIQWEIDEQQKTAILKITTFAHWMVSYSKREYFKTFQQFFKTLDEQGIENLIIDVRTNGGGEEMIGAELLTYLVDHEFTVYKHVKAETLDFTFLNKLPDADKPDFSDKDYVKTDSGYYKVEDKILEAMYPQKKNHFKGKTYIIANGGSFSATSIFLSLAKTHGAGVIIGEESGGTFEDVDGRWRVNFTLPNSGVSVSFPAWSLRINATGGDRLRGVIPDYAIDKSTEDILTEKDVELEFAYDLIRNGEVEK